MTSRTIAFAVVLLCTLPWAGQADAPRLRVFYTGHSFHMFVPARVGLAAKAAGLKEYQLAGTQGIGGSRVIQHWDKDQGDNQARKALEKGDVDVFTMAPHLKIPDEGIDRFVELGLKHNPTMRFLVQQSWLPFDYLDQRVKDNADRDAAKLDVDRLRADHAKWRGEMEAQVKALNKNAGRDAVFIVPAGDAVVKLRALVDEGKAPGITKQSELFTDAIGHGKLPIVSLVSYCNYACITGRSPVGLQVKEPTISAELHDLLQRIAWDTVRAYPMSGVSTKKLAAGAEPDLATATWVKSTAYVVPKETATEGEGYFSVIEGQNDRLYIGTHANGVNSWLVEFDPAAEKMKVVTDAHKAIGKDIKGFGSQAKIHTRNNVGAFGKIYFGTKQGYPDTNKGEKREDYPGGYPMVYDPKTGETKVYPIPVPHEGINSITPDESRGVAYISTCSDHRPGPDENAHFLILDLKTGTYRELIDTKHIYGFIVVDYLGRAYHPMLGGDIVRYDPKTDRVERLKQTIDGMPPTKESNLANEKGHPINWDITPDGKTLYALPMSTNNAYAYDLTQTGDTLAGRSLGTLVQGAKATDCRAMCVGPKGTMWAAITESHPKVGQLLHLVSYSPGDKAPHDHGPVAVSNPDFTDFVDKQGKPLPFHGGFAKFGDVTTTKYVTMGVCEAKNGDVYIMALHPYSVLKVSAKDLATKN